MDYPVPFDPSINSTVAGGGHRSGPGEHPDWQAAMRGLDTLEPLSKSAGWGAPLSLPSSVAALKRLRDSWLGVAGRYCTRPEMRGKRAILRLYVQ